MFGSSCVRERSPYKGDFPLEDLDSQTRMTNMAQQWGEVLATQHARADQDADGSVLGYSLDAKVKAATNGDHAGFRANVRAVAISYADQVELDWMSFVQY